jgi:uncharacterized OB-fold protein
LDPTQARHLHSYVVAHHPPIPPFDYPNVIALVELEEGTRLVSNLVGVDPDDVRIGAQVAVEFEDVGDGFVLHRFRPAARPTSADAQRAEGERRS